MSAPYFLSFKVAGTATLPPAKARGDFLRFKTAVVATPASQPVAGDFLTFSKPAPGTVPSGPGPMERLVVTPGGVPGVPGPRGPSGPASTVPGPMGPPGPAPQTLLFLQEAPAATWTITHNLGTKPSVVLELASDPTGMVITDLSYPDLNTVVVEWPAPETGKAYI